MSTQPKKDSHTKRYVVVAVFVIVLLIVAGVFLEYSTMNDVHITGSYLSIWYASSSGGEWFGQQSRPIGSAFATSTDSTFTESLSIDNNASSPGGGTGNLTLATVAINQGQFTIKSISPALPLDLSPGSGVNLKILIQSSSILYSGPLTYTITVS
ncbi:MAG: hypothetical protein JRN15_00160 [Nitrososphaerota archaeon]|nr:hypothetical protein [Nitrososphaerota archaeon]